jgi:cyclopropane fatty-acyl-phospholipid synthase-like methyltransferase
MDAMKLDFKNYFDFIVSTSFFHHLCAGDCREVCARMLAALKKDGRIIITDGVYPHSWFNIAGGIIRLCDRGRHVRNKQQMKRIFEGMLTVEKEYYFVDRIFAYSVLVMRNKKSNRVDK